MKKYESMLLFMLGWSLVDFINEVVTYTLYYGGANPLKDNVLLFIIGFSIELLMTTIKKYNKDMLGYSL
jgi:hypothetical protein